MVTGSDVETNKPELSKRKQESKVRKQRADLAPFMLSLALFAQLTRA
jgi:hypothetical protein